MARRRSARKGRLATIGILALAGCAGTGGGSVDVTAGFAHLYGQMLIRESEGCARAGHVRGTESHDLCVRHRMTARAADVRAAVEDRLAKDRAARAALLACAAPRAPFAPRCQNI